MDRVKIENTKNDMDEDDKNYMKLLELEEIMWLIKMIRGERSIYWIEYELFYVLIYITNLKLIEIKTF